MKYLIKNGYFAKVFQTLPKSEKGWIYGEREYKQYMLELLEEYDFPKPMPEDQFQKYHTVSDQTYLMLATAGTGKRGISLASYLDFSTCISNVEIPCKTTIQPNLARFC